MTAETWGRRIEQRGPCAHRRQATQKAKTRAPSLLRSPSVPTASASAAAHLGCARSRKVVGNLPYCRGRLEAGGRTAGSNSARGTLAANFAATSDWAD